MARDPYYGLPGPIFLIDEKVITGPHITIITGNHRTNIPGKFMADVTAAEKEPSDDEDVIIKRDVWIGANGHHLERGHH